MSSVHFTTAVRLRKGNSRFLLGGWVALQYNPTHIKPTILSSTPPPAFPPQFPLYGFGRCHGARAREEFAAAPRGGRGGAACRGAQQL